MVAAQTLYNSDDKYLQRELYKTKRTTISITVGIKSDYKTPVALRPQENTKTNVWGLAPKRNSLSQNLHHWYWKDHFLSAACSEHVLIGSRAW